MKPNKLLFFLLNILWLLVESVYSKNNNVKQTTTTSRTTFTTKLAAADLFKTENIIEKLNPMKFLQKNGYGLGIQESESLLTQPSLRVGTVKDNSQMKKMVSMFQTLHFLNVTGELDTPTLKKMASPRCGLPDITHEGNTKSSSLKVGKLVDDPNPAAANKTPQSIISSLIWPKWHLTYKINNSYPGINQTVLRSEIKKAFGYWTEASGLQFAEILEGSADLTIQFVRSDHNDGYPFDGAGGDLAHAFFPQDGRVHFDLDEKFTLNSTDHNFRLIAAHEFGHVIGLDHIFEPGSLMYPYYTGYVDGPPLAPTDIQAVKELYKELGPPPTTTKQTTKPTMTSKPASLSTSKASTFKVTTTTTTTKTTSRTTTTKPAITTTTTTTTTRKQNLTTTTASSFFTLPDPTLVAPCVRPIDAITYSDLNKNKLHVLLDDNVMWEYDLVKRSWEQVNMYLMYPGIQAGSRGAYKCPKTNLTWFFKGSKMWAYRNQQLVNGFPKRSFNPMFPRSPDSVVVRQDRVYLIKGSFLIEFNTVTYRINDYTISRVSSMFPGLPGSVQAAYYDQQARSWLYFIDNWVYKFDEKLNKVEAGYPKSKLEAWGPCMKNSASSNQINELKLTTIKSSPQTPTPPQWPTNNHGGGQYPPHPHHHNHHHHHQHPGHRHGHHHPPYNPHEYQYNPYQNGPPHYHHEYQHHNRKDDSLGGKLGQIFRTIGKHIPK